MSCWICPSGSVSCAPEIHTNVKECHHVKKGRNGLSIEFGCRKEGGQWSLKIYIFLHFMKETLLTWYDAIWAAINGEFKFF